MKTAIAEREERDILAGWQIGRVQPFPTRVPESWELVRLIDVATLESGHTPSRHCPEYWKGDVPWISLHDTDGLDVPEIFDTAQTIGELGLANSSARLLPRGTVVFSRTATVGKATVMGRSMATSQDFANYVCSDRVHNHFLVHLFRFLAPEWKRLKAGSTLNTIYMPVFRDLQVLLPPLPEQKAIAAALSDVDALLGALDRLIAKKRDLKQAVMQQLLTGQTRLPGFSGKWETRQLGEIGRCLRGVSYAGDADLFPHDTTQTKRLLRSNNVQEATVVTTDVQFVNSARVSESQILRTGDILICMANGSRSLVGKSGFFNVLDGYEYTFGAFMGCFRTIATGASPAFAHYLFQTQRYRDYINVLLAGSSINNLRPSAIESLDFVLPSLPEQAAIAAVLSNIDAELTALEQRRDKTRLLKQGMMQELLTGRTRLV